MRCASGTRSSNFFEDWGGPWSVRCAASTEWAEFRAELMLPPDVTRNSEGIESQVGAYSGFDGADLAQPLRETGVSRLFVGELAAEHGVRATVLDVSKKGFQAVLLIDGMRAVDARPGDGD